MTLLKRFIVGGSAAALMAACTLSDPVSNAGGPQGVAQLATATATSGFLPGGSANVRTNIQIDATNPDGFGRRITATPHNARGRLWINQAAPCASTCFWQFNTDTWRNNGAARLDPRFPFLVSGSAVGSTVGTNIQLYQPTAGYPGDSYWEIFGSVSGLKPATPYEIVFVHYRLKVVGRLDAEEMILTGAVTQPDSLLIPAGGTSKLAVVDWTDDIASTCDANSPTATTNPFRVDLGTSSAAGAIANFDKCWQSGSGLFGEGATASFDQAKSMVGRSDNTTYALPNYNYVELWENGFGTAANQKPVLRVQIAQDLNAAGTPVPNGFSPFPAPATRAASSGQLASFPTDTVSAFPIPFNTAVALPAAFGIPDSVIFTLNNVQALASGAYKVWFVNPTTGAAKEASGRYVRTVGTTIVENINNTSTFAGGVGTITFTTKSYTGIGGLANVTDSLSRGIITIEADASAANPSSAQPFWTTVIKKSSAAAGGTLPFGTFNFASGTAAPGTPLVYTPQGGFRGGILGDTVVILVDTTIAGTATQVRAAQFNGSIVQAYVTGVQRPPKGYQYRLVLCGKGCTPTDTASRFLDLGVPTGPAAGDSALIDADVADAGANVTGTRVGEMRSQVDLAALNDKICNYQSLRLVLAPKQGNPALPLSHIFEVALSGLITTARQCQ